MNYMEIVLMSVMTVYVTHRARRKHLDGEVFEMLLTFTDFVAFKELILDYKAVSNVI